ncbi:Arabinose efflux permease [Thermoplasmatales archaeon BRNA1]|nr:Arabinose efflux permease [Thermoplasmatales archaeon BRNA1]
MAKERLFSGNFVLCTLASFFYTIMFFMFYTGMSSYTTEELGCSTIIAGMAASTFVLGDLLSRIIFGRRMELYGKKRVCVTFLAAGTFVCLFYFQAHDFYTLLFVRFLHGLTYGAMTAAINTIIAHALPASRRGEGMGYFMLSISLGSAIGPFLCMWLEQNGTYDDIFTIGTAASMLALLCVLFLKDSRMRFTPEEEADIRRFRLSNIIERSSIPISLVCLVFFFSYSGVLTFISPYGREIGLAEASTYFFVFISIATLTARLLGGRVYDRHGENVALIPFFILFFIGMVMLSRADNPYVLLTAGLLMGFNVAQMVSVGQSLVVKRASRARYSVAISTFNNFLDFAYCIGPIVFGFVVEGIGYRDGFLAFSFVSVASLLLYLAIHGIPEHRHPTPENTD